MDAIDRAKKLKTNEKRNIAIDYINKMDDDEIDNILYIKKNYSKSKQKEMLHSIVSYKK